MWQRFTEKARRVVFYAQEEAQRFGEGYVSTEHILLGLVREPDSLGTKVLQSLGISPETVREEVELRISKADQAPRQDMTLTPRAKRVIDLSYQAAMRLNNNYIGTEHLLLGLIKEHDGLAGRILEALGADYELAVKAVQELQGAGTEDKAAVEEPPRAAKAPTSSFSEMLRAIYEKVTTLEGRGIGPSKEVRITVFGIGNGTEEFLGFLRAVGVTPTLLGDYPEITTDEVLDSTGVIHRPKWIGQALTFFLSPGPEQDQDALSRFRAGAQSSMSATPAHTILVRTGDSDPFPADLERECVVLTGDEESRLRVIEKLWRAGCFGEDWKTAGEFGG